MVDSAPVALQLRLLHGALQVHAAAPGWQGHSASAYREQLVGVAELLARAAAALDQTALPSAG